MCRRYGEVQILMILYKLIELGLAAEQKDAHSTVAIILVISIIFLSLNMTHMIGMIRVGLTYTPTFN